MATAAMGMGLPWMGRTPPPPTTEYVLEPLELLP